MKLYLVRHGEAVDASADPERPLSAYGKDDVGKVARFLCGAGLTEATVYHSDKLRARQTAVIIASALYPDAEVTERQGLAPNDPVAEWLAELSAHASDLMLVGHLQFMGRLASLLLTGKETAEAVHLRTAGVLCLERLAENAWAVEWMVDPSLIPKDS